jgi:hypothetical protein
VLATQAKCHNRGKATYNEPGGVDGHPFLLNVGGFGRIGFHDHFLENLSALQRAEGNAF